MAGQWAVAAAWCLALLVLARLLIGLVAYLANRRKRNVKTMVVLGSGGHTAEMISLLRGFDLGTYQPRAYVIAATDAMSGSKASGFETEAAAVAAVARTSQPAGGGSGHGKEQQQQQQQQQQAPLRRSPRKAGAGAAVPPPGAVPPEKEPSPRKRPATGRRGAGHQHGQLVEEVQQAAEPPYSVTTIPRSREVGQPWLSSAASTAHALWFALAVVFRQRPDLVLVNGPGTCIPICASAWLARLLGVAGGRVVYVESIARVYRLSLSGKILYHSRMAGAFFVQWEDLTQRYPRARYAGRLM